MAIVEHIKNTVVMLGTSNEELGQAIMEQLNIEKNVLQVRRFADGELFIKIAETIRGKDVFLVQSSSPPVNETLMELLLTISTCRRASAKRITAIIPYFGYARQDRKVESRTPISAADVAQLLCTMGVDRVVGVDIHCAQIQGFFPPTVPMDNLETYPLALDWFLNDKHKLKNIVVVSPDAGGVYRAKKFQSGLMKRGVENPKLAMLIKHRPAPNEIGRMDLVGDVKDCDAIIIDDMVDTGGTLCEAARKLKEVGGASRVFAFISHGIFSGPCVERVTNSCLEELVVTDSLKSIQHEAAKKCDKIHFVSLGRMLSQAIVRIQSKESISELF
eukprot:GEMP01036191.1.p1 GENE.GEMP01036191.1~~GEMP01036191.1.p1  ORF type:complete len:331 (+),score=83.43 GEMP01036191.1:86-1078(+)